jgi:hypothetical protein
LLLTPKKWATSVMDRLAKDDPRIDMATARAEVEFREKERCSEWEQQALDTRTWKFGGPTAELPPYWDPMVGYVATVLLAYAWAAAEARGEHEMGPSQFERFMVNCPGVVAEAAYTRKLSRYARVPFRSLGLVISRLARDAEQHSADDLKAVEDAVWRRHRDALCPPDDPAERDNSGPDVPPELVADSTGNAEGASSSPVGRKAPSQYFEAYRAKHPTATYDQIAARIGISRDSLFKIKDETAWVRAHAYTAAGGLLGCDADDLHPRNLPRRPRSKKRGQGGTPKTQT